MCHRVGAGMRGTGADGGLALAIGSRRQAEEGRGWHTAARRAAEHESGPSPAQRCAVGGRATPRRVKRRAPSRSPPCPPARLQQSGPHPPLAPPTAWPSTPSPNAHAMVRPSPVCPPVFVIAPLARPILPYIYRKPGPPPPNSLQGPPRHELYHHCPCPALFYTSAIHHVPPHPTSYTSHPLPPIPTLPYPTPSYHIDLTQEHAP